MEIESILDSVNKNLEESLKLNERDVLGRWKLYHELLSSVHAIEHFIKIGIVDKDKQPLLDQVKEIANTIQPTDKLSYYR